MSDRLPPGTRFAYANTWTIDVNDCGGRYWTIYHVVKTTAKTITVLQATLFHGDVHVDGNVLMDKVQKAYRENTTILNQPTTPKSYRLKKENDGIDCFYTGQGTARKRISLNGPRSVTYLKKNHTDNAETPQVGSKKRARDA